MRVETPIPLPRHYVSSMAMCRVVAEVDFDEIAQYLNQKLIDELLRRGEIRVQDQDAVSKLIPNHSQKPSYVKIVSVKR